MTVAYRGQTLAGLTLTGSLTGPGPVVLQAKVCIELLFFDICFSGTFPLGPVDRRRCSPPPPTCWTPCSASWPTRRRLRAAGAPDPYVRLQPPDPSLTTAVVAPSRNAGLGAATRPARSAAHPGRRYAAARAGAGQRDQRRVVGRPERLVRAGAVHRSDRRPGADPPGVRAAHRRAAAGRRRRRRRAGRAGHPDHPPDPAARERDHHPPSR